MGNLAKIIDNLLKNSVTRRDFLKAGSLGTFATVTPQCIPADFIKEAYSTNVNGTKTNDFMPGDDVIL